jgi:FAD/FMN-containing dehydrogenase
MDDLLDALAGIVGRTGLLTQPEDTAPYCEDWRRLYRGRTPAVVRPASTHEVSEVVRLCAARRVGIVPQGGNTGMVGGAVPAEDGSQIVLSLARMTAIRALDPVDGTLTAEAGLTLKAAQDAAAEAGLLLPLSISSEGTAQLGGVLATNAGGNNTLRHGNARDLLLGLEVVLPDGTVIDGLRRLRKDNTGYCLRQLFAGSEGTLGVITAAVLKLAPRPRETAVAFCAVPSPEAALALLVRVRGHDPAALSAFELMSDAGMRLVLKHIPGTSLPLAAASPDYVLLELATPRPDAGLRAALEGLLGDAMEAGEVTDAVLAESEAQRAALWKLREEHSEARGRVGEERRLGPGLPRAGADPAGDGGDRRADAGDPRGRLRPSRRRQHPLQPGTAGGDGPRRLPGARPRDHGCGECGGARPRRQLLGRAWGGAAEALHDAHLAWRGGAGGDAPDQARARSGWHHESGEGAARAVGSGACAKARPADRS